jgi:hypothetical protein
MDKVKDQQPRLITTKNKAPSFDCISHDSAKDVIAIRVLDGEFKGVEFHFGVLKFSEDTDDEGFARLNFDYTLLNNQEYAGNIEFEEVVAAILYRIIDASLTMAEESRKT